MGLVAVDSVVKRNSLDKLKDSELIKKIVPPVSDIGSINKQLVACIKQAVEYYQADYQRMSTTSWMFGGRGRGGQQRATDLEKSLNTILASTTYSDYEKYANIVLKISEELFGNNSKSWEFYSFRQYLLRALTANKLSKSKSTSTSSSSVNTQGNIKNIIATVLKNIAQALIQKSEINEASKTKLENELKRYDDPHSIAQFIWYHKLLNKNLIKNLIDTSVNSIVINEPEALFSNLKQIIIAATAMYSQKYLGSHFSGSHGFEGQKRALNLRNKIDMSDSSKNEADMKEFIKGLLKEFLEDFFLFDGSTNFQGLKGHLLIAMTDPGLFISYSKQQRASKTSAEQAASTSTQQSSTSKQPMLSQVVPKTVEQCMVYSLKQQTLGLEHLPKLYSEYGCHCGSLTSYFEYVGACISAKGAEAEYLQGLLMLSEVKLKKVDAMFINMFSK